MPAGVAGQARRFGAGADPGAAPVCAGQVRVAVPGARFSSGDGLVLTVRDWLFPFAPIEGPRCPCCSRNDGGHNELCPMPDYIREWKRLNSERAQEYVDGLFAEVEERHG